MLKRAEYGNFDIVFWAHGHNETERYLPVMVELKNKGIKALLFYQNYDFRDGLSSIQQKLIKKYEIDILDYSAFMKFNPFLSLVSLFIRIFRIHPRLRFLYNKFRGLRSRIIRFTVTESLIRKIILILKPKLNMFDPVIILKYTPYPYGSYYIKEVSQRLKIKNLCITPGSSSYLFDVVYNVEDKILDFDKIYVANNEYEKKVHQAKSLREETEVVAYGDPRFDLGWKEEIKDISRPDIERKIAKLNIKERLKIIYLCPNLECINAEDVKYRNLGDVTRLCKELGSTALLIKPHPRYRNEGNIREVMAMNKFRSFYILDDDPLVCYADYVDFAITFSTSAINDFLPDYSNKVVIYDNFFEAKGVVNIYRDDLVFFDRYESLLEFFRKRLISHCYDDTQKDKIQDIRRFYVRWVAAGRDPGKIAENIASDIEQELLIRK